MSQENRVGWYLSSHDSRVTGETEPLPPPMEGGRSLCSVTLSEKPIGVNHPGFKNRSRVLLTPVHLFNFLPLTPLKVTRYFHRESSIPLTFPLPFPSSERRLHSNGERLQVDNRDLSSTKKNRSMRLRSQKYPCPPVPSGINQNLFRYKLKIFL